jgi:hypothetical protein
MNKRLNSKPYLYSVCGDKLGWAAVTELRLLESTEHLGREYPWDDISLRNDSGFEEERSLLGKATMLIDLMRPKRRKTFTSPHDPVFQHLTLH